MYCSNCNSYGHSNKKCSKPINSIGIVCKNKNKIVLVNRKYSHYYIKLLNFNFSLHEIEYIKILIQGLTQYEYTLIKNYNYDLLWKMITIPFLINSNDNTINKTNFSSKKYRYNKLLNGYTINNTYIKFENIFKETEHVKYPNWELPKGKRIAYEADICTALREFKEETGVNNDIILEEENYKEIVFNGWDSLAYSQRFYIYESDKMLNLYSNSMNYVQSSEINKCGWYSLEDIKSKKLFEGMCSQQYKKTIEMLEKIVNT